MAVAWIAFARPRADAMLVPSRAVPSHETVVPASDLQTIQTSLESKEIRGKLHALGLSDEEIQARLSRLSAAQVHQLASQIRALNAAGHYGDGAGFVVGLLFVALLVLLILYLVKRV